MKREEESEEEGEGGEEEEPFPGIRRLTEITRQEKIFRDELKKEKNI